MTFYGSPVLFHDTVVIFYDILRDSSGITQYSIVHSKMLQQCSKGLQWHFMVRMYSRSLQVYSKTFCVTLVAFHDTLMTLKITAVTLYDISLDSSDILQCSSGMRRYSSNILWYFCDITLVRFFDNLMVFSDILWHSNALPTNFE